VKFDHDEGRIKDYIQKIILHVEGVTTPFHVMHGQDENYSKTEENARRNKVLQLGTDSTYVPIFAKLAALGRKMLTDSGVDLDTTTLYDITLNISTCAVPPHVDEPNREGCGAYIVNFPTEDALISFESAWNDEEHKAKHTLQDGYVLKCKAGEYYGFSDAARLTHMHAVHRKMAQLFPISSVNLNDPEGTVLTFMRAYNPNLHVCMMCARR
jgi:hypothetical protein